MKHLYSAPPAPRKYCPVVTALCLGLLAAGLASPSFAQGEPSVVLVQPAGAELNAVSIGGTVIPYRSVTVSAQRGGRITALYVREGMPLQFNQPIAALDDDVLRQQIQGVEAQLRAARSTLDYDIYSPGALGSPAGAMGGMMGAMMGSMFGAPGGGGVDAWLARVDRINQARARIDQLQAEDRALQAQVAYGAITAPMDGIVTQRMVEAGEVVQAGQPLVQIAYVSRLRAEFDIPVELAQGIAPGQPFTLKTSGGLLISAPVGEIAPAVDARTHTQRIKLDLPPGNGLRLGEYVELLLPRSPVGNAGAMGARPVVIPAAALLRGSALPMVQVVTGDGQVASRIVRVAEKLPNGQVVISAGLVAGDIVRVQP